MAVPSSAITRTELSMTYSEFNLAADRMKFIGGRVFRPILVGAQAATMAKLPVEAMLHTKEDGRAPGAGYRRGDFEFGSFSYATNEHGWEEPMDDRTVKVFRDLIDAESIHAQRAVDQVLRNFEIDCATALYDTSTWTGSSLTTAITNEWDDHTNAVPCDDVEAAKQKVRDGCGLEPNALICNRKQFWHAMKTDQVQGMLKYWGGDDPKNLTIATAAALFDLDYIIVAGGIKNSAKEGQDVTPASIWSDEYMMVARVATTDDPMEPCVGRTFIWSGDGPSAPGGGELACIVEEYREEKVRGSVVRARNDRDIVVLYAQAAHLLSNAIT